MAITPRTNHQIRSRELRVIGPAGENYGVITLEEALKKADELGLDLIEISPNAVPPVCKITDVGKYMYEENKKQKDAKKKAHSVEVKNIQVKLGTGENDLSLKARKASEWLAEGNRVKLDLFLPGRAKYLDQNFLKTRMDRLLALLTVEYNVATPPVKSPKGMTIII
ncbi:MAG: translation initiation factor translation initiation factor, partial [Parcubacteria group bacterium]|nr:translation initiation factor translation initiation factor [Parcubacteria group bacterium]